jgi:hypothetical protein
MTSFSRLLDLKALAMHFIASLTLHPHNKARAAACEFIFDRVFIELRERSRETPCRLALTIEA